MVRERKRFGSGFALSGDQAGGFAGDDEFFVGGNHEHASARAVGGEIGFVRRGGIARRIKHEAKVGKIGADGFAKPRVVFADAGGEDESIATAKFEPESADPVTDALDEGIDGELGAGVTFVGGGFDVADVVADAGEAEEAGLFDELAFGFFERNFKAAHRAGQSGGIEIADAVVLRKTGLRA